VNSGTAQRIVLGAWIGMIGLATVRQLTDPNHKGLPAPSIYLASGVLFTMLFGVAGFLPPLAAALAVGIDVGALLRPFLPGGSGNSPLAQLAGFLDGLSGSPPPDTGTGPVGPAGPLAPAA
jgi:hypothetical protein